MSLLIHGEGISTTEITNVSPHGLWMLIDEQEYFLPFDQNPWFREAPVSAIFNVQRPTPMHIRWPDLDVDLEMDAIRYPERYPLITQTI